MCVYVCVGGMDVGVSVVGSGGGGGWDKMRSATPFIQTYTENYLFMSLRLWKFCFFI
jgi:hypothetical protein